MFFSKFDSINTNNGQRRPTNERDTNSNGFKNGNQPRNGAQMETGDQRWYTHVGRSERVEERRRIPAEEKPEESRYYQVQRNLVSLLLLGMHSVIIQTS